MGDGGANSGSPTLKFRARVYSAQEIVAGLASAGRRSCTEVSGSGDKQPLRSHLACAVDQELVRTKFPQTHRAAGVEPIGADADLRPIAKFEAVVEPGTRVPKYYRAVHRRLETLRGLGVTRHDDVAVRRAVAVDRRDGRFEGIHDPHRQNEIEELGGVIRQCRLQMGDLGVFQDSSRRMIAAQLNALRDQGRGEARQERSGRRGVDGNCSAALHTPGRCVLALIRIFSAMSASASRST